MLRSSGATTQPSGRKLLPFDTSGWNYVQLCTSLCYCHMCSMQNFDMLKQNDVWEDIYTVVGKISEWLRHWVGNCYSPSAGTVWHSFIFNCYPCHQAPVPISENFSTQFQQLNFNNMYCLWIAVNLPRIRWLHSKHVRLVYTWKTLSS